MSDADDAIRRVQSLGGSQMAGFVPDVETFLRIGRQIPYITFIGKKVEPRSGTDFVGVGGRSKSGQGGILLVTGGDLSAQEANKVADLLAQFAEEVVIASPHIKVPANIHTRSDLRSALGVTAPKGSKSKKKVQTAAKSKETSLECSAPSLMEARSIIQSRMPTLSAAKKATVREEILSAGGVNRIRATSLILDLAFKRAESELPPDARVLERNVIADSSESLLVVDALDRAKALSVVEKEIPKSSIVSGVEELVAGKRGFLGFGTRLGKYEMKLMHAATIELVYQVPAKIRVSWLREVT